jgi:hypothetical protein
MKTAIHIFLTLLILLGCKPPDIKNNRITFLNRDCKWAQEEFKHDTNYHLMLIRVGIPRETDDYFWTILKDEYDIEIKFSVGCLIDSGVCCYNDLMDREITKKYGSDFYQRVHAKIDSIYKIDKPLIEQVKRLSFIDTTHILRFKVFNTPDNNVKVVSGFGWKNINKKIWYTNLFRIAVDRQKLKIISIDTARFGVEPYKE